MSKPRPTPRPDSNASDSRPHPSVLTGRHLRIGWWTLLVFLTLGIVLEALHAFKIGGYLSVAHETRRLMWTLAHAHGTLLGLVNLAFASTLRFLPHWSGRPRGLASATLIGATLLMPAGFFLGGVNPRAGDPGLGILLLPIGAVLLLIAVLLAAIATKHYRE